MSNFWYQIGNSPLSFSSRPLSFYVETSDSLPYTILLSNNQSGTFNSGVTSTILYTGTEINPSFTFASPLNIRRFDTSSTLFVNNTSIGWTNIRRISLTGNASGNMNGVANCTQLTTLILSSNFSGDITGITNITSVVTLDIQASNISGNLTGIGNLINMTFCRLNSHLFTGNVSSLSNCTSLVVLQINSNGLIADCTNFNVLTALTNVILNGTNLSGNVSNLTLSSNANFVQINSPLISGDVSGIMQRPMLSFVSFQGNFTINYTSKVWASNIQFFVFLPTTNTNPLSSSELDLLLSNLAATTWTGLRNINVAGNNGVRSSASNTAVTSLQGMGATLTLNV